jgi:hypothetical protein
MRTRRVLATTLALLIGSSAARALGTNLLNNPDFDTDTTFWTTEPSLGGSGSSGQNAEDADACPLSDSMSLTADDIADGGEVTVTQCIPVTAGQVRFRMKAKLLTNVSGATASFSFLPFSDAGCSVSTGFSVDSNSVGLVFNSWTSVVANPLSVSTGSIRVKVTAFRNNTDFTVLVDRLFAGNPEELFADGFGIQSVCRWDFP